MHDDEAYSLDILFGLRSNFLFDYINHAGAPIASLAVGSFFEGEEEGLEVENANFLSFPSPPHKLHALLCWADIFSCFVSYQKQRMKEILQETWLNCLENCVIPCPVVGSEYVPEM